jgi:PST family polysaccharide transporter
MNLVRTSIFSVVAVGVKVVSMLAINKILALLIGPGGYALIGQFQNALTALTAFASAGVGTGVTKYTAEYSADAPKQKLVWSTAAIAGCFGSIVVALVLAAFHHSIAIVLLKDEQYASALLWAAACLPIFVLNTLLLAILNGKKSVKRLVAANITNSIAALFTVGIGAWVLGMYGALIALAVGQSISTVVTLWLCLKTPWFRMNDLWYRFDIPIAKALTHFTLMAAATSVLGPLSQMIARNDIIEKFGIIAAGHWEALTRISGISLMFITMPLSVYYLPRLAELKDKSELRKEIINGYKFILPITITCSLLIYLCRDKLILLLFTADFKPMRELFFWQMVGDIFRVAAWLLSFYLLGKSLTQIFLFTEVIFSISYVGLVWWANHYFNLTGAPLAYALNSIGYFSILAIIVHRNLAE